MDTETVDNGEGKSIDEMMSEGQAEPQDLENPVETEGEEGTEQTETEVPAYNPNLKFKVKDKELEFDDLFKPLVKDEETEKKIREWHEKYHGLDEVKKHRDEIRTSHESFRKQVEPIIGTVQQASQFYQRGDVEGTLEALGIDKNKVLEWAKINQQLQHLSPEARAEYNRQRQIERENMSYQQQAQMYQNDLLEVRRQTKIAEIDQALSTPDAMGVQQAFDKQFGPNAFKRELIRRGKLHQAETGEDLPAQHFASELVQMFNHLRQQAPAVQNPQAPQAPQGPVAVPLKKQVPTIPVTKSTGASLTKAKPKSIDEMIKMRDEGRL